MKLTAAALVLATCVAAPLSRPVAAAAVQEKGGAEKAAPAVYDEQADARADVAAALARAKKENRRVLIQWGANWCTWCRALHTTMSTNRDVARKLLYEYDVVRIDVGRFDKNMDLAADLGADFKSTGIPFLTILDADGKPLAQQSTGAFEIGPLEKGHDPQKLVAFLTQYQAKYQDAGALRAAAVAEAEAAGKLVFLHYGAPWCGWCKKLEAWMERPEVAPVLAKQFVDRKIDVDRTIGGADMQTKARTADNLKPQGGIPWIQLLDGTGTEVANTEGPDGNLGFPYQDAEIDTFVAILQRSCPKLTDADLATLRTSLQTVRQEDEARRKAAAAAAGN